MYGNKRRYKIYLDVEKLCIIKFIGTNKAIVTRESFGSTN